MKKYLLIFLTLVMVMLVFSSCQSDVEYEGEKALEVYDRINERFDKNDSYAAQMDGYLKVYIAKKPMTATLYSQITQLNTKYDGLIYQEYAETNLSFNNEKTDTIVIDGYQDGYMYIYDKSEKGLHKYKSPITEGEYLKHRDKMESDLDLQLNKDGCDSISATRIEGEWTIELASFDEENLNTLLGSFGGMAGYFDENNSISDVKLTIVADKKYNLKSAKIEFVFKSGSSAEEMPKFYVDVKFNYGEDIKVAKELNLTFKGYEEVDDLRPYYEIVNEIQKIKRAKEASFKIDSETSGQGFNILQTYEGAYEISDGKLMYEVVTETDDTSMKAVYKDGKQITYNSAGLKQREEKVSEWEARAYIDSMVDPAGVESASFSEMKKLKDNKYSFNIQANSSMLEEIASIYGGTVDNCTTIVTIELDEHGRIKSYICDMKIAIGVKVSNTSYVSVSVTQENICTYEY